MPVDSMGVVGLVNECEKVATARWALFTDKQWAILDTADKAISALDELAQARRKYGAV